MSVHVYLCACVCILKEGFHVVFVLVLDRTAKKKRNVGVRRFMCVHVCVCVCAGVCVVCVPVLFLGLFNPFFFFHLKHTCPAL